MRLSVLAEQPIMLAKSRLSHLTPTLSSTWMWCVGSHLGQVGASSVDGTIVVVVVLKLVDLTIRRKFGFAACGVD